MLISHIVFLTIFSLIAASQQVDVSTPSSTLSAEITRFDGKPQWSPDGNFIGFLSYRSGNLDVWVMGSDGFNPVNVTEHDIAANLFFDWSPDAKSLAYTSQVSGTSHSDIWIVSNNGSTPVNVTSQLELGDRFYNTDPHWSPDSQFISFSSQNNQDADIFLVDITSFEATNLTADIDGLHTLSSWSPDSKSLVFTTISTDYAHIHLWVKSVDGTGKSEITTSLANSDLLAIPSINWSPQGDTIAFTAQFGASSELFLVSNDGAVIQNLSLNFAGSKAEPDWSPDGQKIAFQFLDPANFATGNSNIWVVNADGTDPTNITASTNYADTSPSWSPDGDYIAFESNRNGDYDVWIINSDGSNLVNLTPQEQ